MCKRTVVTALTMVSERLHVEWWKRVPSVQWYIVLSVWLLNSLVIQISKRKCSLVWL